MVTSIEIKKYLVMLRILQVVSRRNREFEDIETLYYHLDSAVILRKDI